MKRDPSERFWEKVDTSGPPPSDPWVPITSGCWLWTASVIATGYASKFWDGERYVLAHRWAYEALIGPIPEGLVIDHLCRVRHCMNPQHMEPVTNGENVRRGAKPGRDLTHCFQGHPLSGDNLYIRPDQGNGQRQCRECNRIRERSYYHQNMKDPEFVDRERKRNRERMRAMRAQTKE